LRTNPRVLETAFDLMDLSLEIVLGKYSHLVPLSCRVVSEPTLSGLGDLDD
jgi:hypothetical protein